MLRTRLWIPVAVAALTLAACSPGYYANRRAAREQRLAAMQSQRQWAVQQHAAAEQQRMMQLCANTQQAFETGHNDGLRRQAMDSNWVGQCPYQYQEQQRAAYMAGYQQGIARAPSQYVVAGAPSPRYGYVGVGLGVVPGVAPANACTFSSDCGPSMHCRQWGGMGSVCMGYGDSGSPCWFGSDCVSGWCEGTGARTCR